jgi:hypothetical protein
MESPSPVAGAERLSRHLCFLHRLGVLLTDISLVIRSPDLDIVEDRFLTATELQRHRVALGVSGMGDARRDLRGDQLERNSRAAWLLGVTILVLSVVAPCTRHRCLACSASGFLHRTAPL